MQIQFTKPTNLDGKQLIDELNAAGIICPDVPNIDIEGNFWLDIAELNKDKAKPIIAAHNGITADEAKLLLS